jgi:hypothetical protein
MKKRTLLAMTHPAYRSFASLRMTVKRGRDDVDGCASIGKIASSGLVEKLTLLAMTHPAQ